MKKYLKPKLILIGILLLTLFLRVYSLNYPSGYVFDEVYHAFTAREYLKGHKEAWEWWTTPPPEVAYEWTHPPLSKEIMAISMYILKTEDSWAWRLPGVLLGTLSVYILYLISKEIFKNEGLSLIAAFIFSLDGLNFVQSRTGMNDIYFVTFMLISLLFILKKKYFLSAIFFGLTIASKWSGIYFFGIVLILLFKERASLKLLYFLILGLFVYMLSYVPFFLQGHNLETFKGLQQQMWWYHTGLKATHDYASPWWSWPLNLYPVWYFVDYHKNGNVSNIFTSGNPVVFWLGFGAIIITLIDYIKGVLNYFMNKTKTEHLNVFFIILLGFFAFWLPWAISPRIMFLYHYSPSVPFLALALAYQIYCLKLNRLNLYLVLGIIALGFFALYPWLVGIPLPRDFMQIFFKLNITKNPF